MDNKEITEALTSKTGVHVSLDYFRATFELDILDMAEEEIMVREEVYDIAAFLGISKNEVNERNYKKDKYKYMFELGSEIELGMIGPKSAAGIPTCSIHLRGQGCREYEARCPDNNWKDFLKYFLLEKDAKPTRVDIAIDDFDGDKVDMNWIEEKLKKKQFVSCFKHKYHKIHGCEEEGFSLELGSRNSSCQLVIYDKLKEQTIKKKKEVNQKYWVRYEMRFFHEKAHKLALELLLALDGKLHGIDNKTGDEAFIAFANCVFMGILDIKSDNNFDINHQCDVETDSKWNAFLNDASKWKISPEVNRSNCWNSKQNSVKRIMPNYFLVLWLQAQQNSYHFTTLILRDFLEYYDKLYTKAQKNLSNTYLAENGLEKVDDTKLDDIKANIENELEERKLPF